MVKVINTKIMLISGSLMSEKEVDNAEDFSAHENCTKIFSVYLIFVFHICCLFLFIKTSGTTANPRLETAKIRIQS